MTKTILALALALLVGLTACSTAQTGADSGAESLTEPAQSSAPKNDAEYKEIVEPLCASTLLMQSFSAEQPPTFAQFEWHRLISAQQNGDWSPSIHTEDGLAYYPQEEVEQKITACLPVTPEDIRANNPAYHAELQAYAEPTGLGGGQASFQIVSVRENNRQVDLQIQLWDGDGQPAGQTTLTIERSGASVRYLSNTYIS